MKKFHKVKEGEWVQPKMKDYLFKCCDCGLVHSLDFRLIKYGTKEKPRNKIQFRAKRI